MYLMLFAPEILIWFSAAFMLGTGAFWLSFADTLPANTA